MKIASVTAHVLSAPLEEPFAFSQFSYSRREAMLVEVRTDDGLAGWGEGAPIFLSAPFSLHSRCS